LIVFKGYQNKKGAPTAGKEEIPASDIIRAWAIFAVVAQGFLLSMFFRVSTAVISPALTRDLQLTSDQLGYLSAVFFYAFALIQIPVGVALDRVGPRITMGLLALVGMAGSALFAVASGFHAALFGRILLGLGMSCNLMGAMTLFSSWFPINRFAFLSGLIAAIGVVGNMLAATPLAALSQTVGWRQAFFIFTLFSAFQAALIFLVVRDRPSNAGPAAVKKQHPFKGLRQVFFSYNYWAISSVGFFRYGFFAAIQSLWAGPFLIQGLGMDEIATGNVLLFLGLGFMVSLPISGMLSDRVFRSRKKVVLPSLACLFIIILTVLTWDRDVSRYIVYISFFLMGFMAAPGQIVFAHIKELVPSEITSTAMTGVNLFNMLGAAFLTQMLGMFIEGDPLSITEPSGFGFIWYAGASCIMIPILLYYFVPDSKAL
jgi:sugar phosphate permease